MRCIPFFICLLFYSMGLTAGQPESANGTAGFAGALHKLKQQSLILDRDLLLLEQQITQPVSIYLTLDTDSRFVLEKLVVKLDGEDIFSHVYTPVERRALVNGGAQLIYKTALKSGKHSLIAYYQSSKGYQGGTEYRFSKTDDSKVLMLHIHSTESKESRLKPQVKVISLEGERHAR